MKDDDGAIIAPEVFVPIAEKNGLLITLAEEIFRQVCELVSSGETKRLGIKCIDINLSAVESGQDILSETLLDFVNLYGIPSGVINIELTDYPGKAFEQENSKRTKRLSAKGIHFTTDDFGSGRMNMDYNVEQGVDIVKFDYTFTQAYFKSRKARHVMESVVAMVLRMGIITVAEGVENKEQYDTMVDLGIKYIQGFYFSRPLPRNEFVEMIESRMI